MRVVDIVERLPSGNSIALHHLTDLHLGAPDLAEKELKERIRIIANDPRSRVTLGGDLGDLIRHNDRRFKPDELDHRYRTATDLRWATMEHLHELLDPIRDKVWGVCDGNHEEHVDHYHGGKFGCEFATNLGVPDRWVDYRGFVNVSVQVTKTQATKLLIDLAHGWQAGRRVGSPQNQAELEFSYTDADILLRGHSHNPWAHQFVTLGVTGHGQNGKVNVKQRMRTAINGGTWRRGYKQDPKPVDPNKLSEVEGSLWGERKGFRMTQVGGPVLLLTATAGGGKNARQLAGGSSSPSIEHTLIEGSNETLERLLAA